MLSMKSAFLHQLSTITSVHTMKLSWMKRQARSGRLLLVSTNTCFKIFEVTHKFIFSIIMEYANNGDLFQKISRH